MIKVKESEYLLDQSPEEVINRLCAKTSRKSMLQFTNTAAYVIFPDRLMIGKKIENGAVISRYRRLWEAILPKIYATWTVEKEGPQTKLKMVSRLGLVTELFAFIISLPVIVNSVLLFIDSNPVQLLNDSLLSVTLFVLGYFFTKVEIKKTEQLLLWIVNKEVLEKDKVVS